jgi:hypothetical protein
LFGSLPICDCAAASPPNPTTAATATVANNLFLISALLRSPAKLSRGFFGSRNAITRLMPCAHRLNAVASVHVLASSPEIGTKFPEVFSLTIFRRWAAEFSLQRRLLGMGN